MLPTDNQEMEKMDLPT